MRPPIILYDLGRWQPSAYEGDTIRREFAAFLQQHGLRLDRAAQRIPEARAPAPWGGMWHDDGLFQRGHDYLWLCVWANVYPTEVNRRREGFIEPVKLYAKHVVVLRNDQFEHRTPPIPKSGRRWFVRCHFWDALPVTHPWRVLR